MNATTFDAVLSSAARLSDEEQQLLAELLRKRQIERWRAETAVEGRRAVRAFRTGKLKSQPVELVIEELRNSLKDED